MANNIDDLGFRCRLEVQRCTEIFQRHMAELKATHTGGRELGLATAARIVGAFRAQLKSIEDAYEAEMTRLVGELLKKGNQDVTVTHSEPGIT